jgi:hypothetical protein
MTVSGLLPSLAKSFRTMAAHLDMDPLHVVGLDLSAITHACLQNFAEDILLHDDWAGYDQDVGATLKRIQKWDCKDVFLVADGRRIKSKLVNASRAASRKQASDVVSAASDAGLAPAKAWRSSQR